MAAARRPDRRSRRSGSGVALLALAAAGLLNAQTPPPVPILPTVPISARIAGLGGADVAMIGYAGSIFSNPAGLAPIRVLSLETTYTRFDETSRYFMAAAAVRIGPVNLGGGTRYLRFEDDQPLFDNIETVGTVTLRLTGVALGASFDYVSVEDSAGTVFRTVAGDLAATVAFFEIAALAFSAQNLGRQSLSGPVLDLPSTLSLGFSLNLIDSYSHGRLLATIQRTWTDGDGRTVFGLEGGAVFYRVGVVVRAGTSPRQEGSLFSRSAFGGSLVLGRSAVDYAYLDRPGRRPLHVFGVRWSL